jgi:hypothetical protein
MSPITFINAMRWYDIGNIIATMDQAVTVMIREVRDSGTQGEAC